MKRKLSETAFTFIIITCCLFSIGQAGEAKEFAAGKIELFFGPKEYRGAIMLEIFCDGLCEPVNPGGTATWGFVIKRNCLIVKKVKRLTIETISKGLYPIAPISRSRCPVRYFNINDNRD